MISCNWGGVRMEVFTGLKWLRDDPALERMVKEWDEKLSSLDIEEHNKRIDAANESYRRIYENIDYDEVEQVRELGVRALVGGPAGALPFPDGPNTPTGLGSLYDSMYSRIIPYGIKGIVWYQGESNSKYGYLEKYLAYMRCMRDSFENPELDIYAIELASFAWFWSPNATLEDGRFVSGDNWAYRRELQQRATEIAPHNHLVTTMELGDLYDIHPLQKKPLAHRAVLKILKHTYGFDIYADQPVFKRATFEGENAILEFENAEGLRIGWGGNEGLKMYVADESHVLKRAKVRVEGNKLILHSDEVKKPVLVRYAFDDYYCGKHVYNKAGLPLAPFRTDDID
jgi:sialate O-acetylesterase